MINLLRQNYTQAFAITDKAAANEAGGVVLWDVPPIYAAAFNPIILTRTRYLFAIDGEAPTTGGVITDGTATLYPTSDVDTAAITIVKRDSTRSVTLSAESFGGVTTFDLSAVVRLWFNELLDPAITLPVIDGKLFVQYSIDGMGIDNFSQVFTAINAVAQVGEDSNMTQYLGRILSRAPRLILYEGYDADFSTLTADGVKRDTTSANAILLLDEQGQPILTEKGEEIYVVAGYGTEIERECVPPQPFYVRWINQLGGVDYWMFRQSQEYAPSVKSSSLYERYVANPIDARSNRHAYAITTDHTVTVGAENIPMDFYEMVAWLPFSPFIEWYNEKLDKWIALTVAKYNGSILTRNKLHGIEITFNLPAINTQF